MSNTVRPEHGVTQDPPSTMFAAGDVVLLERSSAGEPQPLRRSQRWRRGVVLCGTCPVIAVRLADEHGSIVNVAPTALVRPHPVGTKMRVRSGSAFSLGGQQVVTLAGECCAPEDNPSPVGLYHVTGEHYGCGYAYHDELEPAALVGDVTGPVVTTAPAMPLLDRMAYAALCSTGVPGKHWPPTWDACSVDTREQWRGAVAAALEVLNVELERPATEGQS